MNHMDKKVKFIVGVITAAIVAIIIVLAVVPLNVGPHFAFPSYQQVNNSAGTTFTGQKYNSSTGNNLSSGSGATANGAVRAESMNYSAGRTFLELGAVLYKTAADAAGAYSSVNNSIGTIAGYVPNASKASARFDGYLYSFVILPHNLTLFGTTVRLGFSIAVCELGNYMFVIYSNFGGMNSLRMTNLIELEIHTMTTGSLL